MTPKRILVLAGVLIVTAVVLLAVRSFQPPVSLAKLEAVKPGMTELQVREILGSPSRIYPPLSYTVRGTNYQTGGQWTYQRFLTFGYVNVLFGTNGVVTYGHYETF
jgi:hypothetical protein